MRVSTLGLRGHLLARYSFVAMYRNPSPPPSKEADSSTTSDFIGNTVYSKHWVLSALVKLLQYAQSKGARVTVASSSREEIEIEDEWEQELCKLWDASINEVPRGCMVNLLILLILIFNFKKNRY